MRYVILKNVNLDTMLKRIRRASREMGFIKQEINPTNTIIDIIETEKVVDLKEYVENKKK